MLGKFLVDIFSDVPGERTMIAEMFKDSVLNYLYFGLGRNGTSATEFFYSSEFLLRVRSTDPDTWKGARLMRDTFVDEATGKRITRTLVLSDEQIRLMTADALWELVKFPMAFDAFIAALRKERKHILTENREQIFAFISSLNNASLARNVLSGETIPFKLFSQDIDTVLSAPKNPADLAELIRYQPRHHRARRPVCTVRTRPKTARVPAVAAQVRRAPAKGELW